MSKEFQLRPYQQEAINATLAHWAEGTNNCLVALPTGTGKTQVAIFLLKQTMQPGQRALWLAHRDELLVQPAEHFQRRWPGAKVGTVKASVNEASTDIVLASVQTVYKSKRMSQILAYGPIDYLVTDEAHHSICDTYRAVYDALYEANPDLKHVGLTATPQRTDKAGLVDIYNVVSYQMNVRKAIADGWLVPADGLQIETEIDISGVKVARGDFVTGQLEDVLDTRGWYEKVVEAYQEHACGKQAIAYSPGVLTSRNLCQKFLDAGIKAIHVDGTTARDERRRLMASFRRGDVQVLSNCMVAVEGFDAPSAEVVLMCRPTQSNTLFTQIIGRGLRIYPGKERCLVLLFATTGAHILTLHDLGKSKKLKEAEKKDELLAIEGVSSPIPLFDNATFDGVGLYAKAVDLFGSSKGAWFRDGATFSLALGESSGYDRTLVILPPNNGDNWRLMGLGRKLTSRGAWADKHKAKYGPWKHKVLEESPDVEDLMIMATGIIERVGADIIALRSKQWRKDPASAGQLKYARKWASADVLASLTKGEIAMLITHGIAMDELRKAGLT